ncbi:adenylate/guanylate cyclase domain-containing protein [Mycolicibacillus trivialis]|uniref:adenylate/guanylate cyclase domain-containing protein n=1 Tax=Mycolicibacillus trivialis TaxID=1798 RepID=UPI001A99EF46|nr:adenylate/guanylate cyclase domain-containing protein [Mycolicibacillus trivialis]
MNDLGDPVRDTLNWVAQLLPTPVRDLARYGGDNVLAAVLALLGGAGGDDHAEPDGDLSPTEKVTSGILAGAGRYTRSQVAEQAGIALEDAQRLWRALGFAEVGDEERVFTSADIDALRDVAALIDGGILDMAGTVALARPFGHLFSRLAVVQTGLLADVLGTRIADEQAADDPLLAEHVAQQAMTVSADLLPTLERTTVYVWRRHLAVEAGRALLPADVSDLHDDRSAAVGFIDITGFTRLTRGLSSAELAALLEPFESIVLECALAHGGKVIKNLGDEVMFIAPDAAAAAEIALGSLERIGADDRLPPVHAGLAFGPVLRRGGDVYGEVVNVAARITGLARRGTIRVDEAMAGELEDDPRFRVSRRPPRRVRGYLQLHSFRLRRAAD